MPRPTIAQLKARIGSLEAEVIKLRDANKTLGDQHSAAVSQTQTWRSIAKNKEDEAYKRDTELRAVLVTLKLFATTSL